MAVSIAWNLGSIIMTVAIDAHYLPLVDFYALALLASRVTRWVRLRFVLHNTVHCFTFAVIFAQHWVHELQA